MFEPFSGFEELPIRFDVEYQGRTRPVVARIERLPISPPVATLVCSFADVPLGSEWLVGNGMTTIYTLGNPFKYLYSPDVLRGATPQWGGRGELHPQRVQKLKNHVQETLRASGASLYSLRAIELPELPGGPRIALLCKSTGAWCHSWINIVHPVRFEARDFGLEASNTEIRQWLQEQWDDPDSDARFAWEWAQWRDGERKALCCGSDCNFQELERVMVWVLRCSQKLWDNGSLWEWTLHPEFAARGYVTNSSPAARHFMLSLSEWQEWLFEYFAPGWRGDWLKSHRCVQEFWQREGNFQHVRLDEPPTLHERLEARLELRAWLEGKASPKEIGNLLASL